MEWEPFETPDLFGSNLAPPVKVARDVLGKLEDGIRETYWRIDPNAITELAGHLGVRQLEAVMGGNVYQVPRLEAWYGSQDYSFGGRVVHPEVTMPRTLVDITANVEKVTGHRFDSCFVNLYRNEDDHIPWHADDDSWIGPVIASVSLGATRRFWLRRKDDHTAVVRGEMHHGDIVLMEAGCQQEWEHAVPKESSKRGPRLNLTFRQTVGA